MDCVATPKQSSTHQLNYRQTVFPQNRMSGVHVLGRCMGCGVTAHWSGVPAKASTLGIILQHTALASAPASADHWRSSAFLQRAEATSIIRPCRRLWRSTRSSRCFPAARAAGASPTWTSSTSAGRRSRRCRRRTGASSPQLSPREPMNQARGSKHSFSCDFNRRRCLGSLSVRQPQSRRVAQHGANGFTSYWSCRCCCNPISPRSALISWTRLGRYESCQTTGNLVQIASWLDVQANLGQHHRWYQAVSASLI